MNNSLKYRSRKRAPYHTTRVRTRKPFKKPKPYMWMLLDESWGHVFCAIQVENSHINFRNRRLKGYAGWDIDRGRWICRPYGLRRPPVIRGNWRYKMYYA